MSESADEEDSKSFAAMRVGSSPTIRTIHTLHPTCCGVCFFYFADTLKTHSKKFIMLFYGDNA